MSENDTCERDKEQIEAAISDLDAVIKTSRRRRGYASPGVLSARRRLWEVIR